MRRLLPAIAVFPATVGVAPTSALGDADFTDKGPIGWDVLRHLDRFDAIPRGVRTKQFQATVPCLPRPRTTA